MVERRIDWEDDEDDDEPKQRRIYGTLAPAAPPPCMVCKSDEHGHLIIGDPADCMVACPRDVDLSHFKDVDGLTVERAPGGGISVGGTVSPDRLSFMKRRDPDDKTPITPGKINRVSIGGRGLADED